MEGNVINRRGAVDLLAFVGTNNLHHEDYEVVMVQNLDTKNNKNHNT